MSSSSDGAREGELLDNNPFDEAHLVDDPEEIASNLAATPVSSRVGMGDVGDVPPRGVDDFDEETDGYGEHDDDLEFGPEGGDAGCYGGGAGGYQYDFGAGGAGADDDDDDDGADLEGDDDDVGGGVGGGRGGTIAAEDDVDVEGQYNPADYEGLSVSSEVQELFALIEQYQPTRTAIETELDPFIPDFIPAVGDIDAMIKVAAPERVSGVDEALGLVVLDEPCAAQSDPAVLDLTLRSIAKTATSKPVAVSQVADLTKDAKVLDNWIASITELHRDRPPQTIQYSAPMPDVELLMQEWPPAVERLLGEVGLPSAELDVQLKHYVSIACALLDIPVRGSKIEALHVLFSLYVEFKQSQGFRSRDAPPPPAPASESMDVMKIAAE